MNRRRFLKSAVSASAASTLMPSWVKALNAEDAWRERFQQALIKKPWLAAIAGVTTNLSAPRVKVRGKIPPALTGTLYRNGPAGHEVGGERYHHLFDGDGMIQAFQLDGINNRASHKGAFVNTRKRQRDLQGHGMVNPAFGTYRLGMDPQINNDQSNTANINVIQHGGKTLALWEGGSAHEIDPITLETKGVVAWSKETQGMPFSAHPRKDRDGSLWSFGTIGPFNGIVVYHINDKGVLQKQGVVPTHRGHMIHDFMVTERHLVFLLHPFYFHHSERGDGGDPNSYLNHFQWQGDQPTQVILVDKHTLKPTQSFDLPANWVFHFGNAWEDRQHLVFDMCSYEDTTVLTHSLAHIMKGDDHFASSAQQQRVRLNLTNGHYTIEPVIHHVEFPIFDQRRMGIRNRFCLMVCNHHKSGFRKPNRLVMSDLERGDHQYYDFPEHETIEEYQFVADNSGKEMHGWLIGPSFDYHRQVSQLNILNAQRLADGPVATLEMPYIIPAGLHGSFVAA